MNISGTGLLLLMHTLDVRVCVQELKVSFAQDSYKHLSVNIYMYI